jgi:hypothetical protein
MTALKNGCDRAASTETMIASCSCSTSRSPERS